jgi:hypothetical protein
MGVIRRKSSSPQREGVFQGRLEKRQLCLSSIAEFRQKGKTIMAILESLVIGMMCGALIYTGTKIFLGDKANSLPGGAIAAGLAVPIWWAGALGALTAHALCVMAVNYLRKQKR